MTLYSSNTVKDRDSESDEGLSTACCDGYSI